MDTAIAAAHDGELIAGSVEHPERFGLVFDRHFPAIFRYVRRRAGREEAEDVAVETFVVAFRRRTAYEPCREDARPWLFGIASTLLRDRRRAELRQVRAWERAAADAADGGGVDGLAERVDAASAGPLVGAALAALDPRDRDALLLFAWAELSYEEIAEALAVPPGTVRSRIHRARRQVRAGLAAHGVHGTRMEAR